MYTKTADAHSLLRPESVDTSCQEWGWQIFQGFQKYARVPNGYTSVANVKSEKPVSRDMMASFFLSETLKYLYLLLSEHRFLIDLMYVVNSEAHRLPIHKD